MISETFPITVGGDEIMNERELQNAVEDGMMMHGITPKQCPSFDAQREYGFLERK